MVSPPLKQTILLALERTGCRSRAVPAVHPPIKRSASGSSAQRSKDVVSSVLPREIEKRPPHALSVQRPCARNITSLCMTPGSKCQEISDTHIIRTAPSSSSLSREIITICVIINILITIFNIIVAITTTRKLCLNKISFSSSSTVFPPQQPSSW
ncbi:hypothetical protein PoB_004002000 [Plakobranchus ocellatus]|uniref:Uncharacterized protein n=1 Tax=Plakobranchus ocellatus TaxID=259542 RepID=A0AAV4B360_9GAST|nr:hypothetical protein PoB_004002000 [Plakobranchus ocellatus]